MFDSKKIAVAKTVTWRITASITTFLLAWFFTGELDTGLMIGGAEAVAKIFLYYYHERSWVWYMKRRRARKEAAA